MGREGGGVVDANCYCKRGVCWIQVSLTKSNLGIGVVDENAGWGKLEEG